MPVRTVSSSGNVLFYILICVVMFGALGFAVAHMMRGGGNSNVTELNTTAASGIIQYSDTVRNAVRTMQVDGVDPSSLCFDSVGWGNGLYHFAACSDTATNVFDPNGGNVIWEHNSDGNDGSTWLYTGANGVKDLGTTCGNASCAELKMVLPNVRKDVCLTINKMLGIDNPNDNPPVDTGYDATPFAGVYSSTATGDIGDEAGSTALDGKMAGCFQSATQPLTGTYHFYRVLLNR